MLTSHVFTAGMPLLQEALANKQACHPNQPFRAPMPCHWTDMPQDARVAYVELPLPPGCSPDPNAPAAQPTIPPLDEETLRAMTQQVWGHSNSCHFVNEHHTDLLLVCLQTRSVNSHVQSRVGKLPYTRTVHLLCWCGLFQQVCNVVCWQGFDA